jgi:5-methylcytosine-specific restriction endonuclease McrA
MNKSNQIKSKQLGMSLGKASGILRKKIMFWLVCENKRNKCHRCGLPMTENDITIEHKIDWQYSDKPLELFLDLDNISFSHKKCNRNSTGRKHITTNKIGFKGIIKDTGNRTKPYRARISVNNKWVELGSFKTPQEASDAYNKYVTKQTSS